MNSSGSIREQLPFDERNERDFVGVTQRIRDALSKIKLNEAIKATESSLAKLAKCSRGTLANRKWPLDELRAIKDGRKASRKGRAKHPPDVAKLIEQCKGLEEQLRSNRDELLRWKLECDDKDNRIKRLEHVSSVLAKQKNQLERLLKRGSRGQPGNVVAVRFKK